MTDNVESLLEIFRKTKDIADLGEEMTPEDLRAYAENMESICDSIFDRLINPTAYNPGQLLGAEVGSGISSAGAHIGTGIAWAGAWIGGAAVLVAAILQWGGR